MTNEATRTALLRCTVCDCLFTTPSNGDGIRFDGVRAHGSDHHTDEPWDYDIIDYDVPADECPPCTEPLPDDGGGPHG